MARYRQGINNGYRRHLPALFIVITIMDYSKENCSLSTPPPHPLAKYYAQHKELEYSMHGPLLPGSQICHAQKMPTLRGKYSAAKNCFEAVSSDFFSFPYGTLLWAPD